MDLMLSDEKKEKRYCDYTLDTEYLLPFLTEKNIYEKARNKDDQ